MTAEFLFMEARYVPWLPYVSFIAGCDARRALVDGGIVYVLIKSSAT